MAKLATWMVIFWVCVLICLVLLWTVVERSSIMGKEPEVAYSDLFAKVQSGQVLNAVIEGNELRGHLKASPRDDSRQPRRSCEGDAGCQSEFLR